VPKVKRWAVIVSLRVGLMVVSETMTGKPKWINKEIIEK